MAEHLNVHPRATVGENRFFRLGGQAVFEVFSYTAPDQRVREAAGEIRHAGQQALAELRDLVGVLRSGGNVTARTAPGGA